MAVDREALRDWHRLFGLLLTDFFTGSPFTVEVERDLSEQQQFLDVVILRRGPGRFAARLPDGLWWNGDQRQALPWVPSALQQLHTLSLTPAAIRTAWRACAAINRRRFE